ncbi:MAG: flagellar biosynthetic protein FliO [Myxococcales bacterium]|jgi:hypothetical protein|nr:flagellar biosynthetic protein FliO [Myxococcales bacterium]
MPELTDAEVLLLYTGVVLAVMFVFLALLGRRLGGRARAANQSVVGLTGQHRLHVVEIDGRRLLVGTGPSGAPSLLGELDDEPAWTRETAAQASEGPWARTRVIAHGGSRLDGGVDMH